MCNEQIIRIVAGFMVLLSIGLSKYHDPNWIYLGVFVGLNLFQSGFTKFCPLNSILNVVRKK